MNVPPALRLAIIESEATFCREVYHRDPAVAVDALIAGVGGAYVFVEPFLTPTSRVLEIGSGNGFGLCDLLLRGIDVVGVEPGRTASFEGRYDRAAALLRANGFDPGRCLIPAVGEALPFADATFDLVYSVAVLEHVRQPTDVLREAVRVTKPGGRVLMNVPNFWAWYEAHYDIPWCPLFVWSRAAARAYVRRFWGRPDYYVDELQFLTPRSIRRALEGLPVTATIYPYLQWPAHPVSALTWALAEGTPSRHAIVEWLRRQPRLAATIRLAGWGAGWLGCALGCAPILTVALRHR